MSNAASRFNAIVPKEAQITSRASIFEDDAHHDQVDDEEAKRMALLMQKMLGNELVLETEETVQDNTPADRPESEEDDTFQFRLFSNKTVNVALKDETDIDQLAAAAAEAHLRTVDHEAESDPAFRARIAQAAVSFDTIMAQSKLPYPAMRFPHRVIIVKENEPPRQEKKKRKSKKRRDFEKAVKEHRIRVEPNRRDPRTPGGWPGWPGHTTRCAIITPIDHQLKRRKKRR